MAGEDFGRYHLADPRIESLIFWVGGVPQARWDAAHGDADPRCPRCTARSGRRTPRRVIRTATEAMAVAAMGVLAKR